MDPLLDSRDVIQDDADVNESRQPFTTTNRPSRTDDGTIEWGSRTYG